MYPAWTLLPYRRRSRSETKYIGAQTNAWEENYRSGVLMPRLSRQRSLGTVRPSDQSEFASTGDRIAAIVRTRLLVCTLGPSAGAALVR